MMIKKTLGYALVSASMLVATAASAAVTVQYHNGDSKNYEWDAKCSGSSYTVKFSASTTGATTIQGSAPCIVKAPGGEVTLKGGEKIDIKDGKITIK